MRTDTLIERLGHELRPVRPRSPGREMTMLLLLTALEVGAVAVLGLVRPDMPAAMEHSSFWWKLASMGSIGSIAGAVALLSIDPARSPRLGIRWILSCIAAAFASGWLLDAGQAGPGHVSARLDWVQGLGCVWQIVALSVPPAIVLSMLLRRGAPTDRTGTSIAAGLSCAACGAFAFTFACPSDDPFYIAVWYTAACGLVTLLTGAFFKRVIRW